MVLKSNNYLLHFVALQARAREYLNGIQTRNLMKRLNQFFECRVEIPRMNVGSRQTIETLINEEALLFARYLRNESEEWKPRIVDI